MSLSQPSFTPVMSLTQARSCPMHTRLAVPAQEGAGFRTMRIVTKAISPDYLDMVNSLLSSGEVPGLYSPEELEPILTPLREKASNEGFSGNLVTYFSGCKCIFG